MQEYSGPVRVTSRLWAGRLDGEIRAALMEPSEARDVIERAGRDRDTEREPA